MMFTYDQGDELIDNTTSTWTTINEVNGRKFINKTDDSKYVFLPAGGCWRDITPNNTTQGCYWSTSTHYSLAGHKWIIWFHDGGRQMNYDFYCTMGLSIRPVAPPKSQW